MSEEIQFASGEEPATNANNESPDAVNAETQQTTPQDNQEPSEEFIAKVMERVDERTAKQFQAIQSMQAKQENRIKAEFQQRLDAIKEAGLEVTPEQARKILDQTAKQVQEATEPNNEQPNNTQLGQEPEPEPTDQYTQMAMDRIRESGISFVEGDPELQMIDKQTKDPLAYLNSVDKAITAKRNRVLRERGNPAAIPGVSASGSSGASLEDQYEQEKAKLGRGNLDQKAKLRAQYRKLGAKI